MTNELRRGVAYIAARMHTGDTSTSVYDYDAGSHFWFSGQVSAHKVDVYDHDRSCHLGGTPKSLYDYGTSSFFDLEHAGGNKYNGYDYESASFFEVTVDSRSSITVYDYDDGGWHNFSL